MTNNHYDLIVLGLGPGGEELAGAVASAGRSVLGLDPRLVGGECPYFGCIPSKMMVRGAETLAEARRIDGLAGTASVHPDFTPVADRIRDEATDDWNDQVAVDRLVGKGADFERVAGRLAGRDDAGKLQVQVGDRTVTGDHVVVATGTAPAVPPIDGLREAYNDGAAGVDGPVWTNREAVKARRAPESLIVLGGGAIGCELAQAFSRFGSRVSVVEAGERILLPEEPDASRVIADVFAHEGITVRQGTGAEQVRVDDDGVHVRLSDGTELSAQQLLVAAGRRPNLAELGLETVGLDPSARSLEVDDHLRVQSHDAPVDGLYAIGDITGRGAFTHVSVWQARVLTEHLLGQEEHFGGYQGLAWVTFTDPEVGRVGMTEKQARDAGLHVRVGTEPMPESTRGWIHGPGNDGFVRVVEDADRGVLVGATVVGPHGGEILGLLTLAVHAEVPVATLASMHYAFPTLHRAVLDAVRKLS